MSKSESIITKRDLKNTSEPIKKGRGGARPGAGRPGKAYDTQQIHIDTPVFLLERMDAVGIENKTTYIIGLIEKDLIKKEKAKNK